MFNFSKYVVIIIVIILLIIILNPWKILKVCQKGSYAYL